MAVSKAVLRVAWPGLAGLAACIWIWMFPVYFRADDARWLDWASAHANPLAALVPAQATVIDVFRPVQNLTWWVMFRAFRVHPAPYQFVVTALFIACLALLGRVASRIFSRAAGWWSVASFLVIFPYLASVTLWFSDLSYLIETVLMLAAIDLVAGFVAGRVALPWVITVYGLAVLAKEPALVVVPSVAVALLVSNGREPSRIFPRHATYGILALVAFGVLVVFLHPSLSARQGIRSDTGLTGAIGFAVHRWQFYSTCLVSGAGAVGIAVAVWSAWRALVPREGRIAGTYLPLASSLGAAWFLRGWPSVATLAIVACVALQLLLRRREAAAGVWFAVPLLGLLSISFMVRTYLFEAAFGFALWVGVALADLTRGLKSDQRGTWSRGGVVAGLAALVALIAVGPHITAGVRENLRTVREVSAARENFRKVVEALCDRRFPGSTVVVVDYPDMGLDYFRDIVPLSDLEKARRQKTMAAPEFALFLRVAGRSDHTVITLGEFLRRPPGAAAVLVLMNRAEDAFLTSQPIERRVVAEATASEEIALLQRAVRTGP